MQPSKFDLFKQKKNAQQQGFGGQGVNPMQAAKKKEGRV
jgi:hypothetical protein